jgi:hypothetical protein
VMVTGTPLWRNSKKKLTSIRSRGAVLTRAAVEEHQLLEKVHVLLVLQ